MAIWVDHYGMRSALCLDLGIMQLDENGAWLDPGSIREADYNQLVSRDNENMGMTLPAAPTLPGGNMPHLTPAPAILDVEGMIYPRELHQAPPAPKALAPGEMLPSGVMSPGSPPEMPPAVPKPSTLTVPSEDLHPTGIPGTTNVTYQNPIFQRRLPSASLLESYGAESVQHLPNVEGPADETIDEEMPATTPGSISTSRPGGTRTITFHSAQRGAGQSLQTNSAPLSASMAQSRTLPAPYSSNDPGSGRRSVASIEQVGYQRSIETDNSISTTTSQNKSVVHINNTQSR
jgi:hypothetical protein